HPCLHLVRLHLEPRIAARLGWSTGLGRSAHCRNGPPGFHACAGILLASLQEDGPAAFRLCADSRDGLGRCLLAPVGTLANTCHCSAILMSVYRMLMKKVSAPDVAAPETRQNLKVGALIAATVITAYLCYKVLLPFMPALIWAITLAIVARPLQ